MGHGEHPHTHDRGIIMRKYVATVFAYLAGGLVGCGLAPLVALPFLGGVELPLSAVMEIVFFVTGFFMLIFLPFVVVAHVVARKNSSHRLLPLVAFPLFGILFSLAATLLARCRWLPGGPHAGDELHLFALLAVVVSAIGAAAIAAGVGMVFTRADRPTDLAGTAVAVEREASESDG